MFVAILYIYGAKCLVADASMSRTKCRPGKVDAVITGANIAKVDEMIRANSRVSLDSTATEVGINHGLLHTIVNDRLQYYLVGLKCRTTCDSTTPNGTAFRRELWHVKESGVTSLSLGQSVSAKSGAFSVPLAQIIQCNCFSRESLGNCES